MNDDINTTRVQRNKPGIASISISVVGMMRISSRAMESLGHPAGVLIAARPGELVIKAAGPDDHRAYVVNRRRRPNGGLGGDGYLSAVKATRKAVMLPVDGPARYLVIECQDHAGVPALYVRSDQLIATEPRTWKFAKTDAVHA